MSAVLIIVLLALACGLGGWYVHQQQLEEFRRRERQLMRTLREQESAHHSLEIAHRTLEQRAQQLARSNAELERFAHVASHDLKEPVRTVISYTQLLARKYAGALDAEAQEYLKDAAEAARSIRSRIESVLQVAAVGAEGEAEPMRTDCRNALEKAAANLRPAIQDSGALIHCEALPTVAAHAPEVVLVFQNLLDNAIKYRSQKPLEIRISAQRAERTQWQFCLQDNGIGIDPGHADRIFQLFQRLNPQEEKPGMGMGLPVCRKIIERHGGRIWFEPANDGGSRFLFTLPAPAA